MLAALALLSSCAVTQAEVDHDPPPEAVEIIEKWLSGSEAPGVSVAAVGPNGLLWAGGFGVANVETGEPATADTLYQFASVTKIYTGLLLAQLVEEGVVDLDAPLSTYLPEFAPRYPQPGTRPVTIGDIATHTAGFTRDMAGAKASGKAHSYTWDEALTWQAETGMTALPGMQYKYSNFGFAVLGTALARAVGEEYRDLVRTRILEPLGMDASGFAELAEDPRMAMSYYKGDDGLVPITDPILDFGAQAGASELISSVVDQAKFALAHFGADTRVVSDGARDLLFTPRFPLGGVSAISLGWHYGTADGIPHWAHNGSVNNFNSMVAVRPDVDLAIVVAGNGPLEAMPVAELFRLIAPAANTTALNAVVGDYDYNGEGGKTMIRCREDAVLTLEVNGAIRMIPWGPESYRIIEGLNDGEWVRFTQEGDDMILSWESRRLVRIREE